MILTITMNPSIDIAYQLSTFQLDTVNRVSETHKTPGGKGLNVTRVLAQLGDPVSASGLIGGKVGEFIEEGLEHDNISHSFYKISGDTRNCIAILHDGKQTEILEKGPTITDDESQGFLEYLEKILANVELVTISGSLPEGISSDYYSRIIEICHSKNIPVVLDCSGETLKKTLEGYSKPIVIKPNTDELSQLLGQEVENDDASLKTILSNSIFDGIDWVIVSLGAKGAFAKHKENFYRVEIPKIEVVNPVGSGDSTVAGIASALYHHMNDSELLKKANVLGMLNAQEALTGHVNLQNYDKLMEKIKVVEV